MSAHGKIDIGQWSSAVADALEPVLFQARDVRELQRAGEFFRLQFLGENAFGFELDVVGGAGEIKRAFAPAQSIRPALFVDGRAGDAKGQAAREFSQEMRGIGDFAVS